MKKLHKFLTSTVVSLSIMSGFVMAETAQEKGLAIAKERKARDIGWGDSTAKAEMILRNAKGDETIRKMKIKALEVSGDGDKALTIFQQPRDVKGTAFLSFSHAVKSDEQWMYLPALKRVKRIASRNKSGPFMGSEFAFEDLSSFEIEKYTYKYLKDDTVNGELCFVVELDPVDKNSGYTRQLIWVDQSHYRAQKVEFYDRKNSLLKTLTMSDYKLHLEKFWRANKQNMVNNQTKKSTDYIIHDLAFNKGLSEKDFNKATLKRAK
jgi:outer membrane lipoprotein-sorting protein